MANQVRTQVSTASKPTATTVPAGFVFQSVTEARPVNELPPIVHQVLGSTGEPLDLPARAFMEPRFGHEFSRVRVHADVQAAESARVVNALAYTVGQNIVFGAGQYAPRTYDGRHLIAHELTHTIQQGPNQDLAAQVISQPGDRTEQEANAAANLILQGQNFRPGVAARTHIARKDSAASALTNPLSRAEFDKVMKLRYRVNKISTGTFQAQSFGDMKEADWKVWDPGSSSSVYNLIVEAFVNFEKAFGGLPEVKEIVFFETHYVKNSQNQAVKDPDTGASYALGQLTIYHSVQQGNKMLNQQGILESPTMEQAVTRNITHELGHGIAETALTQSTEGPPGADNDLFKDYRPAVGWTQDGKLYDIQEQAVKDAFKNNVVPPIEFQITQKNATKKSWKEKPLTAYMASDPGEDFAEAIMAYVNEPQRLKDLSPARFTFIDGRKARWIASGQPKVNIWEQVKRGGPARVLKPSQPPTIWDRVRESNAASSASSSS